MQEYDVPDLTAPSSRVLRITATTKTATIPAKTNQSVDEEIRNRDQSIRVGRGSLACSDVKNVLNRGSTNDVMTTTATIDNTKTIAG